MYFCHNDSINESDFEFSHTPPLYFSMTPWISMAASQLRNVYSKIEI